MGALRQITLTMALGFGLLLSTSSVSAQARRSCVRQGAETVLTRAAETRTVYQGFARVPIILIAYTDLDFTVENIAAKWDAMANQPGYAEHGAAGCVADYFREQSLGGLELEFDVIGPVTLPHPRKYYGENSGDDDRRPRQMITDACDAVADVTDFSRYDWDGDGTADAVLVVFAGEGENQGGPEDAIWPHMSSISHTVGGVRIRNYACVSELATGGRQSGFGTLCHEFSHCLGLPDLYPASGNVYSLFDQWDLMDGGNYANGGWSPPNYSAFERYLCGWLQFEELDQPTGLTELPPLSVEPRAYVLRNEGHPTEYYILENRRQEGFDEYLPGHGMIVTHVMDYTGTLAPNTASRTQVELIAADNRSYEDCVSLYDGKEYREDGRDNFLSQAAYPYVASADSVNDCLTDSSVPATQLKYANSDGTHQLHKPVTNIRLSADGTVSFAFMQPDAIIPARRSSVADDTDNNTNFYDLHGRSLSGYPQHPGVYLRQGKKLIVR